MRRVAPFQLQNIHRVAFLSAHGGTWETFSSTSGTEKKGPDNQFPEIEKTNPNTIITKEDLEKEVLLAAQNGFAVDYEEEFKGQVCVGAPCLEKMPDLLAPYGWSHPRVVCYPRKIFKKLPKR